VRAEAVDGRLGERAEIIGAEVLHRRAGDPDVGGEPGLLEVAEAGQQLALARSPVAPKSTITCGGSGSTIPR